MKVAVTQLISPFAACRFSRLSSCISKVGPRWLILNSLLPYLTYQGTGAKHCNTCVIAVFSALRRYYYWGNERARSATAPSTNTAELRVGTGRNPSGALRHLLHPFRDFFHRQVALVGCNRPLVAERIRQLAVAVAPEHITDGHVYLCSRFYRPIKRRVYILDIDVQPHPRTASGQWGHGSVLREFVGEHKERIADAQLGMHDLAVRSFHDAFLNCAKGLLVELDGASRVAHGHVWGEGVVALGNCLNGHLSLLVGNSRAKELTPKRRNRLSKEYYGSGLRSPLPVLQRGSHTQRQSRFYPTHSTQLRRTW